MWISRDKYDDMNISVRMVPKLREEIKRLSNQITSQTTDCKMGAWCKDCAHLGSDKSTATVYVGGDILGYVQTYTDGYVEYCKKHLHEICPEFETKSVK